MITILNNSFLFKIYIYIYIYIYIMKNTLDNQKLFYDFCFYKNKKQSVFIKYFLNYFHLFFKNHLKIIIIHIIIIIIIIIIKNKILKIKIIFKNV